MKKHIKNEKYQTGFSLVELMVALTLGLLLTAAVGGLFYSNKQNFNQNTLIAELQDNARFATEALSRDLEMAGFFGGMLDISLMQDDALPNLGADCGVTDADGNVGPWAYTRGAIEFVNDVAANSADDTYSCLTDGTVLEGTDILTVRRVSGVSTAQVTTVGVNPTLLPNLIYLRSNGTAGALFFSGSPAENSGNAIAPALPPYEFWEYYSRIYFVSPSTVDPVTGASTGDNVPTLYRGYITENANPAIAFEALAEGVEDMQIAFGIDTDADGIVNQYKAAPNADDIANAITARIQLLIRSVVADPSYTNNKIYNIFGKDDDGDGQIDENTANPPSFDGIPKDDNFYRRIANTTVILRNPALARGITPQ